MQMCVNNNSSPMLLINNIKCKDSTYKLLIASHTPSQFTSVITSEHTKLKLKRQPMGAKERVNGHSGTKQFLLYSCELMSPMSFETFNNYKNYPLPIIIHSLISMIISDKNKSTMILDQYLPPCRLLAVTVLPALSNPRIASVTFLHAFL